MRNWEDLTPEQRSEYREGKVELHGFTWDCFWKELNDDTIIIFSDYSNYTEAFTHYKSLVVEGV